MVKRRLSAVAVHITLATTSTYAFSTPKSKFKSVHQNYDVLHRPFDISCRATIPRSTESSSSTIETANGSGSEKRNSKLRQLKDRMWVREALEDITAAEFASSLSLEDVSEVSSGGDGSSTPLFKREEKKKKKRAGKSALVLFYLMSSCVEYEVSLYECFI